MYLKTDFRADLSNFMSQWRFFWKRMKVEWMESMEGSWLTSSGGMQEKYRGQWWEMWRIDGIFFCLCDGIKAEIVLTSVLVGCFCSCFSSSLFLSLNLKGDAQPSQIPCRRMTSLPDSLHFLLHCLLEDLTGRFFKSRWTICRPLSRFDLLQLIKKNKLTRQNNADEANASSFSVLAYFNLELVLLYERFQLSIKSGVQKVSRRFCLKSPKFSFNFVVLGGLDQNLKYRCSCRLPSKYSVIWWNSWCTLRHQCSYLMVPCGPLIPPGGFCLRWWSCSLMEKTT